MSTTIMLKTKLLIAEYHHVNSPRSCVRDCYMLEILKYIYSLAKGSKNFTTTVPTHHTQICYQHPHINDEHSKLILRIIVLLYDDYHLSIKNL